MKGVRESRYSVLVVDDDPQIRRLLSEMLRVEGYLCETVWAGREALRLLQKRDFDVLIADIRLPDISGLELLEIVARKHPDVPTIVITGYASIESTKKAMQIGAVDYLPKPFTSQTVISAIERALETSSYTSIRSTDDRLVFESKAMRDVMDMVDRVSQTDSTVLLTGESGTGKELISRAIHAQSRRSSAQFVSVNSGALPEGLLESELFGHSKGAFTGAVTTTLGRFHIADGGTMFLDEVGNMSPAMQVKLLRVLQEQEFSPVGSNEVVKVDVRLIAATNMNLEKAVAEDQFREDLFYRLNVIEINIPPLRHRREDILPLAEHFLEAMAARSDLDTLTLKSDAVSALMAYDWPGNVRELENTIERVVVLSRGSTIDMGDLPSRITSKLEPAPGGGEQGIGIDLPRVIEHLERYYIVDALKRNGGVKSRAARALGLKRTTFLAKMKRLGIPEDTGRKG